MAFVIALPASLLGLLAALAQYFYFGNSALDAVVTYFGIGLAVPFALLIAYGVGIIFSSNPEQPKTV